MRQWFPFYPGDYLRDTQFLTAEEHGCYLLMILTYYSTGEPIPNDRFKLAKFFGLSPQKTTKILATLSNFFIEKDGKLFHDKIEREMEKAKKEHEVKSKAGRKGGQASAEARAQAIPQPQPQPHINTYSADAESENPPDELVTNKPKTEPVPYQKIADLYHDILGEDLPHIAKLSERRKAHIRARWKNGLPSLESWRKYFELVSESDFLMGRAHSTNGRAPFQATIDWLINESNMLKVIEGKYHD